MASQGDEFDEEVLLAAESSQQAEVVSCQQPMMEGSCSDSDEDLDRLVAFDEHNLPTAGDYCDEDPFHLAYELSPPSTPEAHSTQRSQQFQEVPGSPLVRRATEVRQQVERHVEQLAVQLTKSVEKGVEFIERKSQELDAVAERHAQQGEALALHASERVKAVAERHAQQGEALALHASERVKESVRSFERSVEPILQQTKGTVESACSKAQVLANFAKEKAQAAPGAISASTTVRRGALLARSASESLERGAQHARSSLSTSPKAQKGLKLMRSASQTFNEGAEQACAALASSPKMQRSLQVAKATSESLERKAGAARDLAQDLAESAFVKVQAASSAVSEEIADKAHRGINFASQRAKTACDAAERAVRSKGGA